MAFERNWSAVAPQQLTADGGTLGQVQVLDTRGFRVGMKAVLSAVGKPDLQVQIKRVMSAQLILVGPIGSTYASAVWTDVSAYTVASGAYVYADSQQKSKVPANDRDEAVYETEPVVANRVIMVDQLGKYYESANPMPVQLSDGSITIETLNANVSVQLTAKDNDPKPGDVHDSVRLGDGQNEAKFNADGSFNVVVVSSPSTSNLVVSQFGQASSVPTAVLTTIVTYTVPANKFAALQRINASGENIAKYTILLNGTPFDSQRTNFGGDLNAQFDYTTGTPSEYILNAGDILTVKVIHNRPYLGDFEARIQVLEVII